MKINIKKLIRLLLYLCLLTLPSQALANNGQCVDLNMMNNEFFNNNLGMAFHPTKKTWIVWQKYGKVFNFNQKTSYRSLISEFTEGLDTRADGGLISMAFHPKFPKEPYIFITRTIFSEVNRLFVLERYNMSDYEIDKGSKSELLKVVLTGLENVGGHLTFSKEGYLLMSIGDGGNGLSEGDQGLNPHTLPGSLLRMDIDVESNQVAKAPISNPFENLLDGAEEVYAYGFHNPVSFSVDDLTGEIWLGDSGKNIAGEINYIMPKHFYGWSCRDGKDLIARDKRCQNNQLEKLPAFSYSKKIGEQVIGGFVYRGKSNQDWYGKYFFADYVSGSIFSASIGDQGSLGNIKPVYNGPILPTSFAVNDKQEMFIVDFQGRIFEMTSRLCKAPQKLLQK